MASVNIIILLSTLLIAGISAEFRLEMEPCDADVGTEILMMCHVINENPYGPAWAWFRYNADGTHEIIGKRELMQNNYLENRAPGAFVLTEEPHVNPDFEDGTEVLYDLRITAAQLEDNAEYACGRLHDTAIKKALHVRTASSEIHLYGNKNPLTPEDIDGSIAAFEHNQLLHITPDSRGHFICAAEGFIPAPVLTMSFNGTEITHFTKYDTQTLVTAATHDAYKYNVHNVYLASTQTLDMTTDANRLPLSCTATVEGLAEPLVKTVRPVLRVAPILVCGENKKVPNGARNVKLTCILEADPDCEIISWRWTSKKGKKLSHSVNSGEKYDSKYSSSHKVLEDGRIETSMVFATAHPDMFNSYTIYAENEIGAANATLKLIRNYAAEPDPDAGSGNGVAVPSLCPLAFTVLSVLRLL